MGQSATSPRERHDGLARYHAVHFNGLIYATFESAHMALLWQYGNDREIAAGRDYFHLEDEQGRTVRMGANRGHAHAILDALDRHELGRGERSDTASTLAPAGAVSATEKPTPDAPSRGRA